MLDEKLRPVIKKFPALYNASDLSAINTKYIFLLKTMPIQASMIADQIKNGEKPLEDSAYKAVLDGSNKWHFLSSNIFISYFQTDMMIYEKK